MLSKRGSNVGLAVAVAVVLAVTGCATSAGGPLSDPFSGGSGGGRSSGGGDAASITVQVRNANFNEATIEAVAPGIRKRLGRVPGAGDERFTMTWRASNQLRFTVDLLGGQKCTTRNLQIDPGNTVYLTIDSSTRRRANGAYSLCGIRRGR